MTAAGEDEVVAEFFADVGDVDVEEVGGAVVVLVEEVFVEGAAADDFAAVEAEVFEEGVFARGEVHGFSAERDGACGGRDLDIAEREHRAGLAGAAADECAQAGEEFGEVEGFDEVVVGAEVEAADAVCGAVARGEEEDGGFAGETEAAEDLPALELGEHDVEDHGVERDGLGEVEGRFAIRCGIDGIALLAQGL